MAQNVPLFFGHPAMTAFAIAQPVHSPSLAIATRLVGFLASTMATATLMVFFC